NALMEDLLPEGGCGHPVVRRQAARFLTETGLEYYRQDAALAAPSAWRIGVPFFTDPPVFPPRLAAAQDAWQRAAALTPVERDCSYCYLGVAQAHTDLARPDLAEAEFARVLPRLPDRPLRADILATLGDAYFQAGQMAEARKYYAKSVETFM